MLAYILQQILDQLDDSHKSLPDTLESHRQAILSRLKYLDNALLVIDGLDCLVKGMQDAAETQLNFFQAAGLKIMASTRALPLLPPDERYWKMEITCDGEPTEGCDREFLKVFWVCGFDQHAEYVLCMHCRAQGLRCVPW